VILSWCTGLEAPIRSNDFLLLFCIFGEDRTTTVSVQAQKQ
jgi:hypothetical protein